MPRKAATKTAKVIKATKAVKSANSVMPAEKSKSATSAKATKTTKLTKSTSRSKTTSKSPRTRKTATLPEAPIPPIASLEEPSIPQLDFDPNAIINYSQLITALQAKVVQITLANDIIAPENILINHDVAINFNGYSIISEEINQAARVLDIRSGEVVLTGQGKIFAMGPRSVAIRVFGAISTGVPNYTSLTVDEGISLYAPDNYGILISPNLGVAYGLTVNFAGRIFARDGICLASGIRGHEDNLPVVNIKSGARITADELNGVAIEAGGYGKWQISTAKLRAAIGASLRTGVVEFSHTQIMATNGPVFRIDESSAAELEVIVDGGDYLAQADFVIDGAADGIKNFLIKDGDFCSAEDSTAESLLDLIEVEGGDFQNNVKETYVRMAESFAEKATTNIPTPAENAPEAAENLKETEENVIASAETAENPAENAKDIISESEIPALKDAENNELETKELDIESTIEEDIDAIFEKAFAESDDELFLMEDDGTAWNEGLEESSENTKKSHNKKSKKSTSKPTKLTKNSKNTSTNSEKTRQKTSKTAKKLSAQPFANQIDLIPELTDEATDEKEILLELTAEKVVPPAQISIAPPKVAPIVPIQTIVPPAPVNPISENDAARMALKDAIMDIRKLSAEDYDVGFSALEKAIKKAEKVLANPIAELTDIRDAASNLLQAFDGLEERSEFSLSDDELDELFYHGAVLEEMARPSIPKKTNQLDMPRIAAPADPAVDNIMTNDPGKSVDVEPDFTILGDILDTISELNLNSYTTESRLALLEVLDHAQEILSNDQSSQSMIDEIATRLLAQISNLQPLLNSHATIPRIKTSAPAPVVSVIIPATMIDEMTPTTVWSQGITMIDELTPFTTDSTTREKMLRAMRPWVVGMAELATEPARKLIRSLKAGMRAGVNAYRETLHAAKS